MFYRSMGCQPSNAQSFQAQCDVLLNIWVASLISLGKRCNSFQV